MEQIVKNIKISDKLNKIIIVRKNRSSTALKNIIKENNLNTKKTLVFSSDEDRKHWEIDFCNIDIKSYKEHKENINFTLFSTIICTDAYLEFDSFLNNILIHENLTIIIGVSELRDIYSFFGEQKNLISKFTIYETEAYNIYKNRNPLKEIYDCNKDIIKQYCIIPNPESNIKYTEQNR